MSDDGAEVRAEVYSQTDNSSITLLVPADLAGTQQVVVRTRYQGSQLRTETYDGLLQAA